MSNNIKRRFRRRRHELNAKMGVNMWAQPKLSKYNFKKWDRPRKKITKFFNQSNRKSVVLGRRVDARTGEKSDFEETSASKARKMREFLVRFRSRRGKGFSPTSSLGQRENIPSVKLLYGMQLRNRIALRYFYGGLKERQFKRVFRKSNFDSRRASQNFLGLLERRLDVVVWRLGYVRTIFEARQLVLHTGVYVDGKKCTYPGRLVKNGQFIHLEGAALHRAFECIRDALKSGSYRVCPSYLEIDMKTLMGLFVCDPSMDEIYYPWWFNFKMIRESYR